MRNITIGKCYRDSSKDLWACEVRWIDGTEKRCKKTFTSKTKSIAKEKAMAHRDLLIMGGPQLAEPSCEITFKQYADNWMINDEKIRLKPTTYVRKQQVLECQVYPYIGHLLITNVTRADIKHMIKCLHETSHYSPSTIKKARDVVSQVYNQFSLDTGSTLNPTFKVEIPKEEGKKGIHVFPEDECKKIIDAAVYKCGTGKSKYRLGNAIIIYLNTGLRAGELLGMPWSCVDFDNERIFVEHNAVSYQDEDGKYRMHIQDSPKTENGRRTIHMTSQAKAAFFELYKITGSFEYVMTTENGTLFSYHSLNRMFHNILTFAKIDTSKLKQVGLHSLRHTFASNLYARGVDLKSISTILGHCDISITADIYLHPNEDILKKAVKTLEKPIDKGMQPANLFDDIPEEAIPLFD